MGHPTPSTDTLPPSAPHSSSSSSASATAAPDIAATPPPQPPLPVRSHPHALHDRHADDDADDDDDNPPIVDGIDGDDDPQHVHYGGGDDNGGGYGTDYASSLTTSALHALPSTVEAQADQHMSATDGHRDEAEVSTTVTGTTHLQDHEIAAQPVHPTDLAAFSELFARFHTRIEKASAGRKYRPLRDAWDAAADEIARASDRIHLPTVSDLVVDALRLGCESGKIVIVDACLDCIHRLFEYGHLGAAGESPSSTSSDKSSMNSNNNSNIIALDMHHGTTLDVVVNIVCACLEVKDEDVYLRMVQTLLTAATRTKSGLHQSTLLAAVRTIYNIFLNARMPGTRTTARVSLTQILNLVFSRMEAETTEDLASMSDLSSHQQQQQQQQPASKPSDDDVPSDANATPEEKGVNVPDPSPAVEEAVDGNNEFVSVLQRDAYLLFRALCKLSAKENIEVNTPDHVGIRSKMLSLELIRILINSSGPAFRSGDRFVYALRQYLARSLLINCTWNSAEVMDISFDIFETLLRKDTLRRLLKSEIRVMFETVVFRFLESPTAGLMRKRRVLSLLNRLSADRQTMADLFLNYDCDIESPKIFERIVNAVSTTAQSKMPLASTSSDLNHSNPAELNVDLRIVALSAVIQVVRSLREWSAPLETEKERTKTDGSEKSAAQIMHSAPDDEISPSSVAHVSSDDLAVKTDDDDPRASLKGLTDSATLKSLTDSATIRLRDSIVGVISEGSDLDTTRFEEALKAKRDAAEGIKLFNTKPKRGIDFLVKNGRIREEPEDIAKFLHKTDSLDAAMVGEYIGDGGAFNISVMHAYTDMYDFTGMTFDGALRLHLSGFRLPGEAQKIDRIMEKFASRYCECNPDIFANADAAYVLAYSCIMLHTDAHNNTIKNKMSKDEFIRNNRGINDGGDLDPIFLGKLYERITTTEIRLSSTKRDSTASSDSGSLNASAAATAAAMDPAQRARQFEQESERLLAQTKVLFTRKGRQATQEYTYYSANNVHHARLMFDTAWYPILAAVSLNLEEASTVQDNNRSVPLCLEGFRHGIAISSLFSMGTAKNAFVSSLAKFTHLNSISEMRTKNVECVRMILAIAANEGNNLGEQWVLIVRAVSILEQIRAVASGNPDKYLLQNAPLVGIGSNIRNGFDSNNTAQDGDSGDGGKTLISMASAPAMSSPRATAGVPVVSSDTFRRMSTSRSTSTSNSGSNKADGSAHKIDPKAASLAKTVPEGEIDRIFTNSSNLSATGVTDFCGALCTVALEELSETPAPRLFCIQKIVEMAYYNMDSRTRIQWAKIWDKMNDFFVKTMTHTNRDVAMYSIDALRQLASKFLEKDELSNFAFQKSFLRPFETCYSRAKSVAVRELVLSCISQIVLARATNIKSGWKSVFAVLALAADDHVEALMNFGWQIVDSITRKYVGVLEDVYVDAVMGISAYARTTISTPVSLAALELLSGRCPSSLLAWLDEKEGGGDTEGPPVTKQHQFSGDDDGHIGLWFPILTGLAAAMQDERGAVRLAANNGLFKVLTDHGGRFSPSMWTLIFRGVLSPIFDDVRHLSGCNDKNEAAMVAEWAATTGVTALQSFVDVFVLHLEMTQSILDELLGLIRSWIMQENESVAREGMSILARLAMRAGDVFSSDDWTRVIQAITKTFTDTMPHEIVGSRAGVVGDNNKDNEDENRDVGNDGSKNVMARVDGDGDVNGHGNDREGGRGGGKDEMMDDEDDEETGAENKIDFRVVRSKCVVQLLLIEVVQEVVVSFYEQLATPHIVSMSQCLEMSYTFAHKFNADIELRYSLWRTGFMNQVPNLLKQETNGLMAYLRIMFWLYLDGERRGDVAKWSEERVMALCESVLGRYIRACEEAPSKSEERREVAALSPVVLFIVNSVMQMSQAQFEAHLHELYGILLELVDSCDDRQVRLAVTTLLRARVVPTVSMFHPQAQLPGTIATKVLSVKVAADASVQTEDEVCAAVTKVGGVRSVEAIDDRPNCFEVIASAPDEMIVSGALSLPFVKAAFVEVGNLHHVD